MKRKQIWRVLLGSLMLLMLGIFTYSQEYRGTIVGKITDPQSAVIPNATVIIKNVGTNVETTLKTNDEGNFTAPLLIPGKYSVAATANGFKTSIREQINLNVDDRLVIDIQLEVGTEAQQVTVTADSELVERGSVTIGTVISEQQISELPLAEGAAYNLATQAPGVVYTGNPQFSGPTANGNLREFRTNGAGGNQINLDGSPNVTFEGQVAYTPPADAVSQFKIQTSSFDAQNGFTGGSTVNVAVKSGTNQFHGSGYYFDRDKIFTANNFFSNRAGVERPERKYYRYGGQINGPVYIPKIYDGKDRTFFMFSYEKQYNRRPEPEVLNVPTAKMRTGDFSELSIPIYDPTDFFLGATNCAAGSTGSTVCRRAFAGNIIPANRIYKPAMDFLKLYPLPNQTGTAPGLDNYFSNQINTQPYDSYLARVDHNFSGSNKLFGKFFYSKSAEDRYNWIDSPDAYTRGFEYRTNRGGNLNYTSTLSSHFILDLRTSYNEFVQERRPANPVSSASLGFTGIDALTSSELLPRFDIRNFDTLGPERSDFNEGLNRTFRLFSVQPTITQIYGNHILKYGYDYRRLWENRVSNGFNAGRFYFDGIYTMPASNSNSTNRDALGRDLAAFLLGYASTNNNSLIQQVASYDVSYNYHGLFIQDDWRITPKLTLNVGLRYEIESGVKDSKGRIVTGFDVNATSPLRAQVLANYNANVPSGIPITAFQSLSGGYLFANSPDDETQSSDTNNWQPRVGVSYAINDKTVIRGGFGIFVAPFQIGTPPDQTGFTAQTQFAASTNNGQTFIGTLANPFPNGVNPATGSGQGLLTNIGASVTVDPHERRNANYARFALSLQRELPFKIGLDATVLHSRGYNLAVARQLNYVPNQYLVDLYGINDLTAINNAITAANSFLTTTVPNPFRGLVPSNAALNGNTIARSRLLSIYPSFEGITMTEYNGKSDYTGLQFQITKRFSRALSLNSSYSYANDYEKVRRLNNQDSDLVRQVSTFSRPHRFTFSGIYELPIGRKRAIGSNWNRWLDALLGGWQFQGVYEWQSGEPLQVANRYYNGDPRELVNLLGQRDEQGRRYGIDIPAFDTSKFKINGTVPGFGSVVYRTFPLTLNNFRNQPFQKFDAGFTKNFRIGEGMRAQLRIEGINVLNWVYFTGLNLDPTNANFGFANSQRNLPRDIQIGARFTF